MANIHQSITELVGHTPLVELKNYEKSLGLKAHLLGKLECSDRSPQQPLPMLEDMNIL